MFIQVINSLFRRPLKFSVSFVSSSLFPGVPSANYHGDPSKSLQGFTLCFQFLFLFILLLPEFLHGGYTWWFIKDLFPSRSVHQDSFLSSLSFFILQSGVQFFHPYHWRWYYVILDNLSSCFMIHMLLRMRYFKSFNLVIGVILGYISP